MPRSPKCKRICTRPRHQVFSPPDADATQAVTLRMEELEALRLCDLEALGQDQAAQRMEISRGTLQRMLYAAHRKVAEALLDGKPIAIGGGNYALSKKRDGCVHGCRHCRFAAGSDSDECAAAAALCGVAEQRGAAPDHVVAGQPGAPEDTAAPENASTRTFCVQATAGEPENGARFAAETAPAAVACEKAACACEGKAACPGSSE